MVVNIYASVLRTGDAGELRVIVSALPAEPGAGIGTFPNRSGKANDPREAKALAERLADDVRKELELFGHEVRSVSLRL